MRELIDELNIGNEFKVKFDGEQHEIDANTLINSLIHLNAIIQEINREVTADKKIEVKIKALEKGSFLVHIELMQSLLEALPALFTSNTISNTANIVTVLGGLYALKKFLFGRQPAAEQRSGNSGVTVHNERGEKMTVSNYVYNIYTQNAVVNDALTKNFQTLENDESITGFSITDVKENPIVSIPREDFSVLAEPSVVGEKSADSIYDENASLSIVKISFDAKLKSEFYYQGSKITARVLDQSFNRSIDDGRQFAKGDTLKVLLKINRAFDAVVNHVIIKGYDVVKVLEHIPRPKQQPLFPDDPGR